MANTLISVDVFKAGLTGKLGGNRKLVQFVEQESASGLQVGTFKLVTNDYVGDATVVPAGTQIELADLKQSKTDVTFEKVAKGVAVTDEEKAQTFGDPVGNAENQVAASIDGKMEAKIAELLNTAKFSVEYATALDGNAILDAIGAMGEGIENAPYYLVVTPADYATLQKAVGFEFNLNNNPFGATIVMSSRITTGTAFLIQKGAVKEIVQTDTDVEVARNAGKKQDEIYADRIHAVYIQDQSKIVKIAPTA